VNGLSSINFFFVLSCTAALAKSSDLSIETHPLRLTRKVDGAQAERGSRDILLLGRTDDDYKLYDYAVPTLCLSVHSSVEEFYRQK